MSCKQRSQPHTQYLFNIKHCIYQKKTQVYWTHSLNNVLFTISYTSLQLSNLLEPKAHCGYFAIRLRDKDALPVKTTIIKYNQSHTTTGVYSRSLPSRRGSTSGASTERQLRAVAAIVMLTTRDEELDLAGNTRVPDRLDRAASGGDTFSRRSCNGVGGRTCAVSPNKASNGERHCLRGGGEESTGDEDGVEFHFGEIEQLLNDGGEVKSALNYVARE